MGFSQDLKDFTKSFGEFAKLAKPSDRQLQTMEKEQDAGRFKAALDAAGTRIDAASAPKASGEGAPVKIPTFQQLEENITRQESGGNYKAIGPTHPKLGRALGYAQVMEANLPQWSVDAVGREVSADEFLNDPDLQKKIVRHRLGGYYNQYGPEGAASMWFTGGPKPRGKRDSLGTVDHDYVDRAMGRRAAIDEDELGVPVVYAASGGLIPDAGQREDSGSNPAVRDAVEDDYDPMQFVDMDSMANVVRGGMGWIQDTLGFGKSGIQSADPRAQEGVRALASNAGAPSPDEVEELKNTVDPRKKLPTEELRHIAAWNAMYKYHSERGELEKANRAAGAMLMYSKRAAQQAGTMALATDDPVKRAKTIAAGYTAMPDGQRMEVSGATKNGVKFKLIDDVTGKITEEGEATMDQMVEIATGMQNGTEWFRAAGQLASKGGPDKVAARTEDRRKRLEEFATEEGTDDANEYRSTLSDAAKAKYDKLDPADQTAIANRYMAKLREDAKGERFETRQLKADEKEQYRRDFQLFDTLVKQGRWEDQRARTMSATDRRLALIERDLSDRNARAQESREERKARYAEIDRRILERGAKQGVAGGRLTASERADQAIDQQGAQQGALDIEGRGAIKSITTGKADTELGDEEQVQIEKVREQRPQRVAALVDTAFKKRVNDKGYEYDTEVHGQMPALVDTAFKALNGGQSISADVAEPLGDIANEIAQASHVPPDRAAKIAALALKSNRVQELGDGRVRIGDQPPVYMSGESFLRLMQLRGRQAAPPPPPRGPGAPAAERPAMGGLFLGHTPGERQGVSGMSASTLRTRRGAALDVDVAAPTGNRSALPVAGVSSIHANTTQKYDIDPKRKRREYKWAWEK
jgi:hypothetical protein